VKLGFEPGFEDEILNEELPTTMTAEEIEDSELSTESYLP